QQFRSLHWEGSFDDYLQIVANNPAVARNAFQRLYDMVLYFGSERYSHLKRDYMRYKFFGDPVGKGQDAIYGLDGTLMQLVDSFNADLPEGRQVRIEGELDPFCRKTYDELLVRYNGDWRKVMKHVVVRRIILSEKDRRGIGTFQPKDEKNQDSTELTGDINY